MFVFFVRIQGTIFFFEIYWPLDNTLMDRINSEMLSFGQRFHTLKMAGFCSYCKMFHQPCFQKRNKKTPIFLDSKLWWGILVKKAERELKMVSDQPLFRFIVWMCHLHFNSMSRQKGLCSNISHNAFNFANIPFLKGNSFAYFTTNRNKS